MPIARSCSTSWRRGFVVEFVTKRRRWPASRRRLTARAQLGRELCPRTRRRVRDEAKPVAGGAQLAHGLRRSGDGLA
jgi:hypothetical protein